MARRENTQRRNRIRYFLNWTTGRGLSRQLTVPLIPRQEPADLLDDDERWQLLQRCLTDEALPTQARAAGALILLFALQAQRIRHLTADQLTQKGDDTYLTAGRHPMLLPPHLGALLQDLASRPPTPLMIPTDRTRPAGCSPAESPDNPSTDTASPTCSTGTASALGPPATEPSPHSPPTCPPRSSPTSSASTSTPPSAGSSTLAETGPTTSPHEPLSTASHSGTNSSRSAAYPTVAMDFRSAARQRV